ncbi:MAG: hypothetical protein OEV35_06625 [Gallionellaceae bacterium]|nr:hypothetical protein [Gallionellaceae bacterium]
MKLSKIALTLIATALLPALASAATDPVAASFDRAFYNESFVDAYRTKSDQVAASFEREFGNEAIISTYRPKSDGVLASFERDLDREPIAMEMTVAKVGPLDIINSSLSLGKNAIVASFERDLLGNATSEALLSDTVWASFARDLYREPIAVTATVIQGDDSFFLNEPDTILANFYRELHWVNDAATVVIR